MPRWQRVPRKPPCCPQGRGAFLAVFTGAGFGRTLGQGRRRRAFGHGRGIGARHTSLGGLVLGFSLVGVGLFSLNLCSNGFHHRRGGRCFRCRCRLRSGGSRSFHNLGFFLVAGAADDAGGRDNLGRLDDAGLVFGSGCRFLRGLGSLGRNRLVSGSGSGRGRIGHCFYHRGSFLGRFGFNRCGNGGFLRCGFGFLRGVLAAAAHDDVALRTGALRINLFLFGKVVAQASGLL